MRNGEEGRRPMGDVKVAIYKGLRSKCQITSCVCPWKLGGEGSRSPRCGRREQMFTRFGKVCRSFYTESSPAVKMGLEEHCKQGLGDFHFYYFSFSLCDFSAVSTKL